MGWQEGKGIGRSEDGRTDNIKVSLKLNNYGIGADAKTSDNWLENAFGFDDMLKGLGTDSDSTLFIMPEDTAKDSRCDAESGKPQTNGRHLHRRKFIKNKKGFSSVQINNILGKTRDGEIQNADEPPKQTTSEAAPTLDAADDAKIVVSQIA
ncbi:PIN2/TERF1-interacting telomerase inhibitor 1, partial [Kappamyces sp. JEL0680]